ncbi:MAG: hypothetical protein Q4D60_12230 [Eubacteriales bacterium]|nr:hypothetical protein [Eubacteriales bacterium]
MQKKDEKVIETIMVAIPKMSEFDKGYFLGKAEAYSQVQDAAKNEIEEPEKTPA